MRGRPSWWLHSEGQKSQWEPLPPNWESLDVAGTMDPVDTEAPLNPQRQAGRSDSVDAGAQAVTSRPDLWKPVPLASWCPWDGNEGAGG